VRLANELAQRGRRAQTARAIDWKWSGINRHKISLVLKRRGKKGKMAVNKQVLCG
jgi:hypothetical protein